MKQLHIYVSGFVQGVGYRRFLRSEAKKRGLTGWVTNLSDRRVEAVIQGPEPLLQELVRICEKGPFLSEVKDVSFDWEESTIQYPAFTIHK